MEYFFSCMIVIVIAEILDLRSLVRSPEIKYKFVLRLNKSKSYHVRHSDWPVSINQRINYNNDFSVTLYKNLNERFIRKYSKN